MMADIRYLPRWPWEVVLWLSGVLIGAFLGRLLLVHVHHITRGR
jgi:hypothetical protein